MLAAWRQGATPPRDRAPPAACPTRARSFGRKPGLTPKKCQSGEVNRTGRFSKVGDAMVRTALFEAATVLLKRTMRFSVLKAWALRVASRQGLKKGGLGAQAGGGAASHVA